MPPRQFAKTNMVTAKNSGSFPDERGCNPSDRVVSSRRRAGIQKSGARSPPGSLGQEQVIKRTVRGTVDPGLRRDDYRGRGRSAPKSCSLHGYALRQVAGLVDVRAFEHGDVVGEELDRDRVEQ